ncbi:MAG: beta-lactamase family protein [Verrucomicrobia bacterium]|nr:beta-lactamase family protein [Verrucomicrobiota bacterium]
MRWRVAGVCGGCWVITLLGLWASEPGHAPAAFEDPDRRARIEAVLPKLDAVYERHALTHHLPGYAYGVVVDGRLIHSRAWGLARIEPAIPVTTDTRFRIASMTKSVTALAILKLRDAGKLTLEDPLERHVRAFRKAGLPTDDSPKITVRHVLTMTAGFPQDDPWGDRLLDQSPREFQAMIAGGLEFSNPPGVTWEYSNLGYALLGEVISHASGRPYQEYITREILRPLGMTDTGWEHATVPGDRLAQGYRWEHGRWQAEPLLHDGAFGAMGGLITTLGDLAKYQAFHLEAWPPRDGADSGPVSRATRREMHRPAEVLSVLTNAPVAGSAALPRVAGYSYGLSWNQDARGVIWLRHGGGLPGYGCEHRFLPDHGVGLIALANRTYAPMTAANAEAMEILLTEARLRARLPIAPPMLRRRAEQLAALLQSWDPDLAADALSSNVFLDRSESDWKAAAAEAMAACGAIRTVTPIRPQNLLRGRFDLIGDRGRVEVFMTLMPERPPRIQQIQLKVLPTATP